jgi:hypothetical protein
MGASKRLRVIVHEGDDEAETEARTREAQERALAEHIAAHPEDAGLTVRDFIWLARLIVHRPQIADDEATAEYVESLRASRHRSSADPAADKDSDKRQRAAIAAFAKAHGYVIVEEFYDAAVSGADLPQRTLA